MYDSVIDWKKDSQSFDTVAELYDTYRPSYPVPLVEQILSTTDIPGDGRILEIGSGTGKATILFAQRGYSILCIEPGEHLARIARKNLAAFPKVNFQLTTFENWESDGNLFDLVISAQAFHWVTQEVRYQKTAHLLKPRGYLVIFYNHYRPLGASIRQKLDHVYQRYAPELGPDQPNSHRSIQYWINELSENDCFDLVEVKRFLWQEIYSTPQYLGLLNTYSDHLRLPEERRQKLFGGIKEILEQEGNRIEKPYEAVAYIARKHSSA
ncbi:MAG TPA: class I SAM-dependent methyltransferase [Anaerolineales bacterium]|nr:class I SAM-dependent methyltransferase [Anaerolineales bacterium]